MIIYLLHLKPIGICQLFYNSDLTALPVNIVKHFNLEIMFNLQFILEEVIFRIIPENSGLFSGLIRKIVPYFPD